MRTRQRRNSRVGLWIVPIFCVLVSVYFAHHAFKGKRGITAMDELLRQEIALQQELEDLRVEREKILTKVALLRPGTIEKDMLDEQARYHLNMLRKDELVIFNTPVNN